MKSDSPNAEDRSICYEARNNFICGTDKDRKTVAIDELKKLCAEGKTVVITDNYLFSDDKNNQNYVQELTEILKSLKAREILCCVPKEKSNTICPQVQTALAARQCTLKQKTEMEDWHDRFWFCVESEKAVVFGTSLNGLCKRICRVDELSSDEVAELKAELMKCHII